MCIKNLTAGATLIVVAALGAGRTVSGASALLDAVKTRDVATVRALLPGVVTVGATVRALPRILPGTLPGVAVSALRRALGVSA